MLDVRDTTLNQRGMALVVAVLVLVFLSLLASALVMSMSIETRVAGLTARADRALNTAEAGVAEALERIRKGDVPDNGNPKMVSQIFLAEPGTVPIVGADTVALPTWQERDKWLAYSTSTRGPDVLTVSYKTNAARTSIFRYDPTKNPAVQTATGQPIFVVSATGRFSDSKRTIVTEVIQGDVKNFAKGAVMAKKKIHIGAESWLCGYNHSADTPSWTNVPSGRNGNSNACNTDLKNKKWEMGTNDIVGAWSEGKISDTGKGKQYGVPTGFQQNQTGFYSGAWEVLGMTQTQFFTMLGPPVMKPKQFKGDVDGVVYVDADGKKGKNKGTLEIKNGQGQGLLYVEGDLKLKGDFVYRGLVYATGKITFDGRAWVLGAVISERDLHLHVKKNECAILYSKDAIARGIGQYVGPFVTLSWRERP